MPYSTLVPRNTLSLPVSLCCFVFLLSRQAKVAAAIADKDVGILVNNVGVSYPFPKYFDELTDDEVLFLPKCCPHLEASRDARH